MATFNPDNVVLTDALAGAVPITNAEGIVQKVIQGSAIMKLGKYIEMKDKDGKPVQEKDFSFLAEGPGAYWVGEGEKIQTSKPKWLPAKMTTKKLGVIIPVSREFLHYKVSDFFKQVEPLVAEAFHKKFDEAGILNVSNPFANSIEQAAVAASNVVEGDISFDNVLAVEDALYDDGHSANAFISKVENNTALRGASKTENGVTQSLFDRTANTIDSLPAVNLRSAEMEKGTLYAGDFNYLYYGIPYTLTYQVSEEATLSTIKNEDGSYVNLFEQELIALRATMDVGMMIVQDGAFAKLKPIETP